MNPNDCGYNPTAGIMSRLDNVERVLRGHQQATTAAARAQEHQSVQRKSEILGHTVALTSDLIAQHQNYDAGTIAQIIPVIFKALDEASR